MTLDPEQAQYVKDLAFQAAYGAWANDPEIRNSSVAYLEHGMPAKEESLLVRKLVTLAALDADHAWEAPVLTGKPAAFACAILEQLNKDNA